MALRSDQIGSTYEGSTEVIDGDRAVQYADATNDPNPAYRDGELAPPVFGVVPTWGTMGLAVASVVPPESLMMVVHGEQDMHFHQPLRKQQTIASTAEAYSIRVGGSGTRFTVRVRSDDADGGGPVLEQYVTLFIRGVADGDSGGPDKPDHTFPEAARPAKAGDHTVHVDDDQTFRYRDASGDNMPIHVDEGFAKSVGLPGIIAHGLCTMAMASQSVLSIVAGGDPSRLRRLAVRFAKNVFPGDDVTTHVYRVGTEAGREVYAFETVSSRGDVVITNGRAEVDQA